MALKREAPGICEQLKPLPNKALALVRLSSDVATWTGETCDQAEADRVGGEGEYDGYRRCNIPRGDSCG